MKLLVFLAVGCQAIWSPPTHLIVKPMENRAKREISGDGKNIKITDISITSEIQFRYTRTTVQTYMKNFGDKSETTQFKVILPNTAFISNFSMVTGGKEYIAEVKEKTEASREFTESAGLGQGVALVEKDARNANLFQIKVSIEPEDKVLYKLTYDELLERRFGLYEQLIHVQPGQIVDNFNIKVNINESLPLLSLSAPDLLISNEIDFVKKEGDNELAEIKRNVDGDPAKGSVEFNITKEYQQTFGDKGVQGQFSITYDVDRENQTNEIQVIDGYFVHFFSPENLKVLPKHIIFVLDVSGSMYGEKMEQLKDAMFTILDEMTDADFFDIITFSTVVSFWKPAFAEQKMAYKASKENKKLGIDFILQLTADGGTNINDAIQESIKLGKVAKKAEIINPKLQTMILFMTDGMPTEGATNSQDILNNIKASNIESNFPVFSLAFGRGADFDLLVNISTEANSRAKQIYEGSDAALQLEGFYHEISSPLLSDVKFKYVGDAVEEGSLSNPSLKTFFKGTEFIVAGKISPGQESKNFTITIEANAGEQEYSEELSICLREDNLVTGDILPILPLPPIFPCIRPTPPPPPRSDAQNFLKNLYSFLNIKQLLRKGDETSSEKALNMSLENNFVTDVTSLIAKLDNDEPIKAVISEAKKSEYSSFVNTRLSFVAYPPPMRPKFNAGISSQSNQFYDYDENYNSYDISDYSMLASPAGISWSTTTTTTTATTTTTTAGPCTGTLNLYSKTYNRGDNLALNTSAADLGDFNDRAVTVSVEGTCCWDLYSETGFRGDTFTVLPNIKYTGVSSLKNLLQNVKSVQSKNCY